MALRMTGLSSGLDTESIVAALMEAQKAKKTKVDNNKTKLEWKQDIWKDLNTKLYSFYTNYAGKMRFQTNYMTKKVSSSNSSKVTATAKTNAVNGSYSVKVNKLASAQNVTSGRLQDYQKRDEAGNLVYDEGNAVMQKVTGKSKLTDMGVALDSQIQITANNGKKISLLTVNKNTTVNDFVQSLKDAGLNASFDEKQGRFFIGSSASGANQDFQITTNKLSDNANNALVALRDDIGYADLSAASQNTVMTALSTMQESGCTDEGIDKAVETIKDMLESNARTEAKAELRGDFQTREEKKYYEWNDTNNDFNKDPDGNRTLSGEGKAALQDLGKYTNPNEAAEEALNQAKQEDPDLPSDKQEEIKAKARQEANEKNNAEVDKLVSKAVDEYVKSDGYETEVETAVNTTMGGYHVEDKVKAYAQALEDTGGVTEGSADPLKALGLDIVTGTAVGENDLGNDSQMVVVEAADSVVELNGATLTSSSTTLEVNGLTLNLTGVTDEAVNLSVASDTQGVYDMVKEFVNQYNSILSEMNKLYYAKSSRGYEPLTDDQKSEMSDEEVEKWETKIKDSLLRRDSTLGGLLSAMRSTMTGTSIKASNGKTYSLANLGITTGKDYKEFGLLHIKGDEDDTDYADSDNTLMDLLNEDPSVVTEVLSGITSKLYNNLTKKMQSSSLSSALTFYNDKEMNKQLSEYNKEIKQWEIKLNEMEDRYYKQFTAMEKAMANMQSQQNALSGFFG